MLASCRTRMGGGSTEHVYAACRGYVVVLVLGDLVTRRHFARWPRGGRSAFYYFDDSFTSTRCLYLSPSQLCLIKRICTSYASARTHTCPCAYARARTLVYIQVDILYSGTSPVGYNACAWTLAARESVCSVQSILGGGASLQFRRRVSL